ncbi:MAG: OPT/YSL family transporter [Candidatus Babeliales bacterium]
MNKRLIIISILLSLFSTAVMAYISLATPIGPWIGPTLALFAVILFKLFGFHKNLVQQQSLAVTSGSIGGIIATACGFSFPTLYFLSPHEFNEMMSSPLYFCGVIGGLSLVAWGLGLYIADLLERRLIIDQKIPFPIGELMYEVIVSLENSMKKTYELLSGFLGATLFSMLQDGFLGFKGFIPRIVTLIPAYSVGPIAIPPIIFDIWPIWWAIGYVSGYLIAVPLCVGFISKLFVAQPINLLFFADMSASDFILAFGSGMVFSGALSSLIKLPKSIYKAVSAAHRGKKIDMLAVESNWETSKIVANLKNFLGTNKQIVSEGALVVGMVVGYLSWMKFTLLEQGYLTVGTVICSYQIVLIAGKTGLALLGRFATFVLVPALFLFGITNMQVALVSTFVEITGGVATDILVGRKIALLADIDRRVMRRYQILGLLVSAIALGIIFWLLINHFTLGSDQLFAQRAQARALLVSVQQFSTKVLLIGALFGEIIKRLGVNPMMVLGGLLMPINITLGLVFGGLIAAMSNDAQEYIPFWSGVFAANSLWMLTKALM